MHPACQKWTSDLWFATLSQHPRAAGAFVYALPANPSAAHFNGDLAGLQALAALNILDLGSCLGNPQVMVGVGVNTDVGLGDGGCGRHGWDEERRDENFTSARTDL